jgi:hypothetical protein
MLLMAYNVFRTVIGQTAVNPVVPGAAASTTQLSSLAQA